MNIAHTTNVPWKPEAILKAFEGARGNPEIMVEYIKQLVIFLDKMYTEIANSINATDKEITALKTRYDAHTTHPPPV